MKKIDFFKRLVEDLELDNIMLSEETNLKTDLNLDSMANLVLITIADEEFSIKLTAEKIEKLVTIGDLINILGIENFEN